MKINIDDDAVKRLIYNYPKLNELNDAQLDTVGLLVRDAVEMGIKTGDVIGSTRTAEDFSVITNRLVIARTFIASISALFVAPFIIQRSQNVGVVFLLTAVVNTSGYYLMDLIAKGLKFIADKLRKKVNDSAGSSSTDSESQS